MKRKEVSKDFEEPNAFAVSVSSSPTPAKRGRGWVNWESLFRILIFYGFDNTYDIGMFSICANKAFYDWANTHVIYRGLSMFYFRQRHAPEPFTRFDFNRPYPRRSLLLLHKRIMMRWVELEPPSLLYDIVECHETAVFRDYPLFNVRFGNEGLESYNFTEFDKPRDILPIPEFEWTAPDVHGTARVKTIKFLASLLVE